MGSPRMSGCGRWGRLDVPNGSSDAPETPGRGPSPSCWKAMASRDRREEAPAGGTSDKDMGWQVLPCLPAPGAPRAPLLPGWQPPGLSSPASAAWMGGHECFAGTPFLPRAGGERPDDPDKHLDEWTRIHSAMESGGSPARIRSSTISQRSGSLFVSARMSAWPCRCSVRSLSISDRKWSLVLHFLSS